MLALMRLGRPRPSARAEGASALLALVAFAVVGIVIVAYARVRGLRLSARRPLITGPSR